MKEQVKQYIIEYRQKMGGLPSPSMIAAKLSITKDEVKAAFQGLLNDGFLKIYTKPVNGNGAPISSYHVPREILSQIMRQRPTQPIKEKRQFAPTGELITKIVILFVCFIMLLIAVAAMCVSIYFTFQWTSTFLPAFIAALLSGGLTLYISFAPEGALLLYQTSTPDAKDKNKKHLPAIGYTLIITAALALFFSMSMTIIGQFNANSEKLNSKYEISKNQNNNFEKLEILKKEELDLQKSKKITETEILEYQKQKEKYNIGESERSTAVSRLDGLKSDLKKYDEQLFKNRAEQKLLLSSGAEKQNERFSFYTWFQHSFGTPSGTVEFILYLIPALFCDLIAPLGVSLVVFLTMRFFRREKNA